MTTTTDNEKGATMRLNTKEDARNKIETWFKGNKARFTGEVETLYGGLFGRAVLLDGSEKGKVVNIALKGSRPSATDAALQRFAWEK